MCGIVGIINKRPTRGFNQKDLDLMKTLLLLDTMRGWDSTGIFAVDSEGDIEIFKDAITGGEMVKSTEFTEAGRNMVRRGFAMIGHNRAATRGVVNDKNAHPFWYDNTVVMVHNGTFIGDHKKHADVEVDSEALCHLLGSHEPSDVENVFNKIHAAYACVWYDNRDCSINLIRNDQRPLHFYDAGHAWYISSEKSILSFAMARNDIKHNHEDIKILGEHNHTKIVQRGSDTDVTNHELNIMDHYDTRRWSSYQKKEELKPETTLVSGPSKSSDNVIKLPAPVHIDPVKQAVQAQQEATKVIDSFRDSTRKERDPSLILEDLGKAANLLPFDNFNMVRECYPDGCTMLIHPTGCIDVPGGRVLLYGKVKDKDDVYGAVAMDEKVMERLIDTAGADNYVRVRVIAPHWMNTVTSVDQRDWRGICVIYGTDPENTSEKQHACC